MMIALSLLVGVPSFAVQYIDCVPEASNNNDHVIVSLKDRETGTLFLSSGINDDGSHENSGILELKFSKETNGTSVFHAENSVASFDFSLPTALVQARTFERFFAGLELTSTTGVQGVSEKLNCFTRLY